MTRTYWMPWFVQYDGGPWSEAIHFVLCPSKTLQLTNGGYALSEVHKRDWRIVYKWYETEQHELDLLSKAAALELQRCAELLGLTRSVSLLEDPGMENSNYGIALRRGTFLSTTVATR